MSPATTWGTRPSERTIAYPCDRYVAAPCTAYYRGVTVNAPAAVVFRWLCQLRVAPYSYDWLDNGGRRSPQRLTPDVDKLAVGQRVMTIFDLVEFTPEQHITLKLRPGSERVFGKLAVTYLVMPSGENRCRLLVKLVVQYPHGIYGQILRVGLPAGDLLMMRRQLLNLKRLAEAEPYQAALYWARAGAKRSQGMQANNQQASEQQNPYIFGDEASDRFRLETQTRLFSDYLRQNARRLVGDDIHNIIDLGCGEGQLTLVLHEVYPDAHIIGIDRDERAIAKAQELALKAGATNVEFVVGDVQKGLPAGPFDLAYASMLLQHLSGPLTMPNEVFNQLKPGGYFWVKMPDAQTLTAFDNAAYRELFRLFYTAIVRLGADPYMHDHIESTLQQHGFTDIKTTYEEYILGGPSKDGQAMMGITLGIFYSGRGLMARMNGITEQQIMDLYVQVVNAATNMGKEVGVQLFRNDIARKPVKG